MKKEGFSNTSFSLEDDLLWRFDEAMNKRRMRRQKSAIVAQLIARWIENERVAQKGHASITNSDDSGGIGSEPARKLGCVLQIKEHISELSEEEGKWVERALRVLRSGKESLVEALTSNLQVFEESAEQHERERGQDVPPGSAGKPGAVTELDTQIDRGRKFIERHNLSEEKGTGRAKRPPRKNSLRG